MILFPDAIAKGFFLLKDVLNRCIQLSGASGQKPQNDKFRRAAQIFKNFNRIWLKKQINFKLFYSGM